MSFCAVCFKPILRAFEIRVPTDLMEVILEKQDEDVPTEDLIELEEACLHNEICSPDCAEEFLKHQ